MKRALLAAFLLIAASVAAQNGSRSGGPWTISGTIVSAEGSPLSQSEVTLSTTGPDAALIAEIITGDDGAFRFPSLPTGKYAVGASHRGYITADYQEHEGFFTAIVTGPDLDFQNIRLELRPWAVIDGSVTDDNGDPVPGAQVVLWGQNRNSGTPHIVREKQQNTDDTGTCEFADVRPGTYYLSVSATPWYAFHPPPQYDSQGNMLASDQQPSSPLDVVYPLTFYPNATDSSGATPIDVHAGDRLELNMSLHAVPAAHIQLHIPVSRDGSRGVSVPQIAMKVFGSDEFVRSTTSGAMIRNGFMDAQIDGIPPGHYNLRSFGEDSGETSIPIDVTGDNSISFPVSSSSGVSLTGKLAMADGAPLPDHLSVNLRFGDAPDSGRPARVGADGTFTFPSVSPGTYALNAFAPGSIVSVLEMAAAGAQVSGNTVTVSSDPVLLAATIASGSAILNGFARHNGKGVGGAMIVLVPADPHAAAERYRRDQSDSDGSFTLEQVVPGNYTLVAIEDGWSLDWSNSAEMARYLAHGLKVQVPMDRKLISLTEPVEIQSR